MMQPVQSFREFEVAGWEDTSVCSNYDQYLSALTRQSTSALLDAAGVQEGTRVLDVATGAGYIARAAAERGAVAMGVDFSASQVAMARNRNPTLGFEQSDADALPFPAESFDAVVCNFGMCHFPDPEAAVREAFRVLKPGGRIAFTVWSTPEKAIGFGAIYGAVRAHGSMDVGLPTGPNFFLFSDPEQCRRILTGAGFLESLVSEIRKSSKYGGSQLQRKSLTSSFTEAYAQPEPYELRALKLGRRSGPRSATRSARTARARAMKCRCLPCWPPRQSPRCDA